MRALAVLLAVIGLASTAQAENKYPADDPTCIKIVRIIELPDGRTAIARDWLCERPVKKENSKKR